MKRILLYVLVLVLTQQVRAQIQVKGTVYDSTKRNLVMGVQVICTCGTMGFTDSTGRYSLFAGEQDSIFFFFRNKPTQKFAVQSIKDYENFDLSINLYIPGRYKQLKEIIVYGKNRKQDSIDNRLQYDQVFHYDKGGLRFSGSAPETGMGAGIDLNALINVFRFRHNRSMQLFQQRLIREEQNRYVDYRFNKSIILKLTQLKDGPELERFVQRYKPDYGWLTQVLDIELYQYIQLAAKEYLQNKPLHKSY
ncbi:MAG: hypothetical protein ACOVP6_09130 [Lacibacter sp.]